MSYKSYTEELYNTIQAIESEQVENFISLLYDAYNTGRMVFVIGNGGSAANASHLAQDLAKGTRLSLEQVKRIRALSLTDNLPFVTALGNDDGYDTVFEQQLRTFAGPGDILVAISGSGNSPNIIRAVEWANKNGLRTVGITGFDGGRLRQINQHSVHVPLNDMCTAESVHSIIFHFVILELQKKISEDEFFTEVKEIVEKKAEEPDKIEE
ncbi:MAG: SIS domain-containing protein [archaeon]